jgi:hypothetical protein
VLSAGCCGASPGTSSGYAIDLGVPPPTGSMFGSDPEIAAESVRAGPVLRPAAVLAGRGASGGPHPDRL